MAVNDDVTTHCQETGLIIGSHIFGSGFGAAYISGAFDREAKVNVASRRAQRAVFRAAINTIRASDVIITFIM